MMPKFEELPTVDCNEREEQHRLWEQAIADEDYLTAAIYTQADWSEPTLYSHGVPVAEVQQQWDDALELFNKALRENANADTVDLYDKKLAELIRNHIEVVFPEVDAKP